MINPENKNNLSQKNGTDQESGMLFSSLNLNEDLLGLINKNKYFTMKLVQAKAIPTFLLQDVIVQSQTVSGKTLAYLIPIFNKLFTSNIYNSDQNQAIQALIIVPTRELCNPINEIIENFGVKSEVLIGGIPIENYIQKLNTNIIVGTPGRLFEIVSEHKNLFKKLKYLVIDECDKLFGFEFESKLLKIIELLPKNRITGLFSATLDENVKRLSLHSLKSPITIKTGEDVPEKLSIKYKFVEPKNKIEELFKMVVNKKCIVFMSTCNSVDFFYELFKLVTENKDKSIDQYIDWHKIHGKMDQKDRNIVYSKFEESQGVLICTDVAARGIDFKNVDLVIHFDVPKDYTNVVHRSGRTARNGMAGNSVIFLMKNEKSYVDFMKLKGIELEPENECTDTCLNALNVGYENIKKRITSELLELAVKAFVSYIRSYKEHILNYILNLKELDYDGLAELYFLERIPSMGELKNVKFKNFERPETSSKFKKRKVNYKKN